jgi:hypothetical protein
VRHHAYIVTIVTAQYNDVTADLIARRVLMREVESHSTDKDAVRFKKHQSATCVRPDLTVTMLRLHILLILTLVGTVFTVGKYRLCYAFNVRILTVYSSVQYNFSVWGNIPIQVRI